MNHNYALIIGVHDYRVYDPTGAANVPGARQDARTWVHACLAMGFSPQNIRVLASPPLHASDLGPEAAAVTFGEANRAGIVEGLQWLSEKIGGPTPASGLVTFSGHGDEGENGFPLLCPSDTSASLDEVIDVGALREKASAIMKDNLTMMLDCCHAQAGVDVAQSILMRLRAKKAGAGLPQRARARVVAACARDQQSVSARFLGEEMGAFTWAVTSALGQWKTVVHDGVAEVDVSYGNLVERTRALLSVLSFEQIPTLSGPAGLAQWAFLHPGTLPTSDETNRAPTADRPGHQLDGGENIGKYRIYRLALDVGGNQFSELATIYVTASNMGQSPPQIGHTTMQSSTEYWVFYANAGLSYLQNFGTSIQSLKISYLGEGESSIGYVNGESYFTAAEQVAWTQVNETPWLQGAYVFSQNTGTVQGFALTISARNTPTAVWWVQTGTTNLTPAVLGNIVLPYQTTALATSDFYAASQFTAFNP